MEDGLQGTAHIHRQDGEKLVHGNIKSSNIFIDEQRYGIVSDAGLAKLAYPISCFGIVLLELVSGRQSQQRTDDGELISLDKWIRLDCAATVPELRPRMAEVVRMLEEISGIEPADESRLEDGWEQPTIESRLEDLLEDLLPTLTP
ncbi:UNVERIFIED_CONTAM: putative inactive receptor kinase [Sesamum latifolium]|uniref:Inactive receptor kinase n=1 Tax=Sesamum latifolium TaxID=2727402 RepID=A0AAW2T8V8_9LAMI